MITATLLDYAYKQMYHKNQNTNKFINYTYLIKNKLINCENIHNKLNDSNSDIHYNYELMEQYNNCIKLIEFLNKIK